MTEAEIPLWLKNLPLAPVYRPTETEFADPIAFISRIEREASSFGICKIIPPLPRPSKKFVLSNLNRSLSKSPELGSTPSTGTSSESPVFTTRQQELGSRRARPAFPKQVWQSGDLYTLEQFEGKSKAFARSQLGGFKEVTPLLVESLFWKAVAEKPIYIEYANDVPGSGFAVPEEPFRYISWRRNRKRGLLRGKGNEEKCGFRLMTSSDNGSQQKCLGPAGVTDGSKGTSGWKLSNSRWNLQVIARSPGSLTRFMPDDVPGVTSPMVYIGMLFSWFAWHVEDHELHSMNFLHMGSPKTWYAVPQAHAATLEDIVRVKGYGETVDRLAAFTMLGEKTTLLSPEVLLTSGVPCCRLVQHPGEYVVTFPRAYHIGFSHGFNCGEAANFATPEWLKFAKEAAIRRAAMNHLPMLSHQQLLYILTMSFVSRIPRTLISGVRSSRLMDRKKEEREIFVKKAFLTDMMKENYLLCTLLEKDSTCAPILWEPGMLPVHCAIPQSRTSTSLATQCCNDQQGLCNHDQEKKIKTVDDCRVEKSIDEAIDLMSTNLVPSFLKSDPIHADAVSSNVEALEIVEDEGDLPVGLNIDSGSLACVSCGTLGYPFMAVVQPSVKASNMIFSLPCEDSLEESDKSQDLIPSPFLQDDACDPAPEGRSIKVAEPKNLYQNSQISSTSSLTLLNCSSMDSLENKEGELASPTEKRENIFDSSTNTFRLDGLRPCDSVKQFGKNWPAKANQTVEIDFNSTSQRIFGVKERPQNEKVGAPKWDVSNALLRPRVFCLQHAIEVEGILQSKGGGSVRVICHSDYLKFKAYASTISEEVGTSLRMKDVPLENASHEDLGLISLSIDEEEYQEDGKDWTSKLGVNLKYCVKHRKMSALAQEQLPSALSGMFSSSSAISVGSSLKWLCRKSRTPAKPVSTTVEKPRISVIEGGGVETWKETDSTNVKAIQVYRSRKKKTNDLAFKDHNHPVEEVHSCRQNARAADKGDNLFTVPISVMESHGSSLAGVNGTGSDSFQSIAKSSVGSCEAHEHCFSLLDNTTFVSVPVLYQYNEVCHNISASSSSVMSSEDNIVRECSADSDGGEYKSLGSRNDMAIPLFTTGAVVEIISVSKFDGSVNPCSEHLQLIADGGEQMRENQITEERNVDGCRSFSLSAEDHAAVLGDDSERHIEVAVAEGLCNANCSVHSEAELCSVVQFEGEMRKSMGPVLQDSAAGPIATIASGGNDCPRDVFAVKNVRQASPMNMKSYMRRKSKRKREVDLQQAQDDIETEKTKAVQKKAGICKNVEAQQSSNGFARSPCEGLRSRKGRVLPTAQDESKGVKRRISEVAVGGSSSVCKKADANDTFVCGIEGCLMAFRTKEKLELHERNRCTRKECRERFSNHKHAMRHQRAHNDGQPFKCPWKGCTISFKWEWARTEHLQLHTGERPYRCKAVGCGLSFKFVSEFSRHRRKTGHFASTNGH